MTPLAQCQVEHGVIIKVSTFLPVHAAASDEAASVKTASVLRPPGRGLDQFELSDVLQCETDAGALHDDLLVVRMVHQVHPEPVDCVPDLYIVEGLSLLNLVDERASAAEDEDKPLQVTNHGEREPLVNGEVVLGDAVYQSFLRLGHGIY